MRVWSRRRRVALFLFARKTAHRFDGRRQPPRRRLGARARVRGARGRDARRGGKSVFGGFVFIRERETLARRSRRQTQTRRPVKVRIARLETRRGIGFSYRL